MQSRLSSITLLKGFNCASYCRFVYLFMHQYSTLNDWSGAFFLYPYTYSSASALRLAQCPPRWIPEQTHRLPRLPINHSTPTMPALKHPGGYTVMSLGSALPNLIMTIRVCHSSLNKVTYEWVLISKRRVVLVWFLSSAFSHSETFYWSVKISVSRFCHCVVICSTFIVVRAILFLVFKNKLKHLLKWTLQTHHLF